MTVGPSGDKYEQEADQVAKRVLGQMKGAGEQSVQRQGMEEEELQMKSLQPQIGTEGGDVSDEVQSSINGSRGSGKSIEENVRSSMENAFGADFSDVRIHLGAESTALNDSMNARAFTTGNDIFFRQGEYTPGSSSGKEILAHELTHVVQQTSPSPINRMDTKETPEREIGLENNPLALEETPLVNTVNDLPKTPTLSDLTQRLFGFGKKKAQAPSEEKKEPEASTSSKIPDAVNEGDSVTEVSRGDPSLGRERANAVVDESGAPGSPSKRLRAADFMDKGMVTEANKLIKDLTVGIEGWVKSISVNFGKAAVEEKKDSGLKDKEAEKAGLKAFNEGTPFIKSLSDFFSGTGKHITNIVKAVPGSQIAFAAALKAIDTYKDRRKEFDALKALQSRQAKVATEDASTEFSQSVSYSVKKAWRSVASRAMDAVVSVVNGIAGAVTAVGTLVGGPLGAASVGAVAGAVTVAANGVKLMATIVTKTKGLWKWWKGTRGVAREKNAGVIVDTAMGDSSEATDAATLIATLKPAGLVDLLTVSPGNIVDALKNAGPKSDLVAKLKAGMADKIKST
ncbi:MAG: DUF4157 domain-containing protein [Candidatus Poribacteria bacterium]|nr:DUF4157 domain-containing protein [Candidatus Poribacteria bacterium]